MAREEAHSWPSLVPPPACPSPPAVPVGVLLDQGPQRLHHRLGLRLGQHGAQDGVCGAVMRAQTQELGIMEQGIRDLKPARARSSALGSPFTYPRDVVHGECGLAQHLQQCGQVEGGVCM